MRKIELNSEQIQKILKLYNEDLLGSHSISEIMGINKSIILRTLKENGVSFTTSGRRFIGGKKVATKKWIEKNKDFLNEKMRLWYQNNKEHRKEYLKEYREKNIDRIRETKRNYERYKKATDPLYKLISNFRTAIYIVSKENNLQKYGHYFDTLGYTPEQLIEHLEKQFHNGMTWENYGEWHIDHIKPISSFIFESSEDEEFKRCWSLKNLQPMWGTENIKKGNKFS